MHVFLSFTPKLGLLPPEVATHLYACYAQFDRISNVSRHFWESYVQSDASAQQIAYFSDYMPGVYDTFLRTVDTAIEELLELSSGSLEMDHLKFQAVLSFDGIKAADAAAASPD